jgi:aldose 1-epimerase
MAFEVTVSSFGKHSIIVLKDATTNTFAEIYSFGALLNNFTSEHHGKAINIIDGFSSLAEAAEKVTVFFKSAKLSPFACRVKNSKYKFGQNEYMLSKFALRGTAIHGLIYNAPFEIIEQVENDEKASVKLSFLYENEMEGFPFRFKTEVEYTLTGGNALTIQTTATNVDSQLLPIVDGWHPYFTLGDSINDYQVEFQSKEMLEFDEDLVPTGKLIPYQEFGSIKNFGPHELDNCFTLNFAECQPMCVIRHPQKKVQIEFHPEESYPYLQVYTPEHRKSIAVENLSGAPDSFNNGMGLKVLQPGESATFTTKFITRSL